MKKIFIVANDSCNRRKLDAARLVRYFILNGCQIVSDPERADHIIFVTCAFSSEKKDICIRYIKALSSLATKLVVVGCLPGTDPDALQCEFGGYSLVTRELDLIDDFFIEFAIPFNKVPDSHCYSPDVAIADILIKEENILKKTLTRFYSLRKLFRVTKTKREEIGYLRVAHGCPWQCSYCVIKAACGDLRSKPFYACLNEYKDLITRGYKVISLEAEDVGSYGLDEGSSLVKLLGAMYRHESAVSLQILEMNPFWLLRYEDFFYDMVEKKFIVTLGIQIQSGSDRILKLMNRQYEVGSVLPIIQKLRLLSPLLYVRTHVIVGFPSETTEDFLATLQCLKSVRFDEFRVFEYSDNEKSHSFSLPQKNDTDTIQQRLEHLKKEMVCMGYSFCRDAHSLLFRHLKNKF